MTKHPEQFEICFTVRIKLLGGVAANQHVVDRLHAAIHLGINGERLAESVQIEHLEEKMEPLS